MNLIDIEKQWVNTMNRDLDSSINAWDSVAQDYLNHKSIDVNNNPFLKYLQSKVILTNEMSVLDVGCGAGQYSIALSDKVQNVVGVDFSPKMIEAAQSQAKINTQFILHNWYDVADHQFDQQFDLVFAHTTPAIIDYQTFIKMVRATKRYGILCKPARRSDYIFDQILKIANIEKRKNDDSIAYAFDTLWHMGFNPEISYQQTVWKSSKPIEQAESWYLGRLKGSYQITPTVEQTIKNFLNSISQQGNIEETIHTTLVTLFWEANQDNDACQMKGKR